MNKTMDLVQVLLEHHRELIRPSVPSDSDVIELAEFYGVSENEIVSAMTVALDEIDLENEETMILSHKRRVS